MAAKVLVLFYSTYGHNWVLAKAAAEGVTAAGGVATLKRVPETLPEEVLAKMHAVDAQKAFADVPVATVDELPTYDAIIISIPTRFGGIPAQMKAFIDATGQLWMTGALTGKVGSVMVTSATQHGGNEATILSVHTVMLHHGMVLVGLPGAKHPGMGTIDEVAGGSPYGATSITGSMGQRMPSAIELAGAKAQGEHVSKIAAKLAAA